MYALHVTFTTEIPLDNLEAPFTSHAHALCSVPGLISKTWIRNGATVGGFHLFQTESAAAAFGESELVKNLMSTDGFEEFEVTGYEVLDRFSAMTGVADLAPLTAG